MKNSIFIKLITTFLVLSSAFGLYAQAVEESDCFIITVATNYKGYSPSNAFVIPTDGVSAYNYNVDCGDASAENGVNISTNYTCSYDAAGAYTIKISGVFPHIYFANVGDKEKITSVEQWGSGVWNSMEYAFSGARNMVINATDKPNLSNVTNMRNMFYDAMAFNQDIGDWDVSNVTNMLLMFGQAQSFNQNLNDWDVSNVTTMNGMFSAAYQFNQNLDNWDVSKVTDMTDMFASADSFNQNLNSWDVSSVTSMTQMFDGADSFDGNISTWNVSKVMTMNYMFYATPFNQDIGDWNLLSVENTSAMFSANIYFNQDISRWNVSKVSDMNYMFYATTFNQDIGDWNVSNVIDMRSMFAFNVNFNQDISRWDVSRVENMSTMFQEATSFNRDIGRWNVSSVWWMDAMFQNATSFNQDIGDWNVIKLHTADGMFRGATSFNQDIGDWNTVALLNINYMFYEASSFNQDIGDWNTSGLFLGVADMFKDTPLSVSNYDSFLDNLNSEERVDSSTFVANISSYCQGEESRTNLIEKYNWTFEDLSEKCNYYIDSSKTMEVKSGISKVGTISIHSEAGGLNSFTILGGTDGERFIIDSQTGELSFKVAPSFTSPTDRNLDNIYRVQVQVSDGTDTDVQTVRVIVTESATVIAPIISYLLL